MNTINTNSIFAITEETMNNLSKALEEIRLDCTTDDDYLRLNAQITVINSALFAVGVKTVAHASNPFEYILQSYDVPQFKAVARTEKGNKITLKDSGKVVQYSDVVRYINKFNKDCKDAEKKLNIPFANADYVLINIYGANISKEQLSSLDCHSLNVLSKYNSKLECFNASSNSKMKEQLQTLFNRITELSGSTVEAKAIERHTKLISMEFIKYKGLKHTLTISNADKLIDLIICQYIISRDKKAITIKSNLDCHKAETEEK